MRVFSVEPDGGFTEYEQLPFETDHAEADLEQWLEANPGGILEDIRLLIIGRQVPTDLGKSIDLLGVDREGNVVVVELKRDRTPRDVVAQALEYAAFAAKLDAAALERILGEYRPDEPKGLAEQHREYFDQSEAIAFNKDQRIVIIGQQVTPEIRQTALFLESKGVPVTCVEFTFFQAVVGGRLLSQEIVVGGNQAKPRRTAPLSRIEFLEACDDHGRAVYSRILDLANREGRSLNWEATSFSVVGGMTSRATISRMPTILMATEITVAISRPKMRRVRSGRSPATEARSVLTVAARSGRQIRAITASTRAPPAQISARSVRDTARMSPNSSACRSMRTVGKSARTTRPVAMPPWASRPRTVSADSVPRPCR